MSDIERIEQRLSAVERAVVDGDVELDRLADLADLAEDVERLEARLEEHERRLAALEGSVEALDGFVGNVKSVNQDVERQADAAIAAVDRLEYRIDEFERQLEASDIDALGNDGGREGTEPSPLESADAAENRFGGAQTRTQTQMGPAGDDAQDAVLATADAADVDDAFGDHEQAEETADALLEERGEASSGGDEAGDGIQRSIRHRLAVATGSSDDGDDSDDRDGGITDRSDGLESDGDDGEPSDLVTSIRDRLP